MRRERQRSTDPLELTELAPDESNLARTANVLVDILAAAGVEVVFGLPGGAISPIHDAFIDHPEVRVITTRHEAGAMFAAAGYAQTTGKLGVALVTSGPGALNAMTGLASAQCDGLPVLLLVGEVPRSLFGKGALQDGSSLELNIVGVAKSLCKMSIELSEPNQAPATLHRLIATAMSGRRGPVMLTLPMDVSMAQITAPDIALDVATQHSIDPKVLDRVAAQLARSKRTIMFVGSGVRPGKGPQELLRFAEKLQCPVMTTPKAKGVFPENHPLSLGVFGMGGHPSAKSYLEQGIDVLLGVGTSFGDLATDGWSPLLKPERAFIHVDIDARQIGRAYPATLGIAAPAALFFSSLADRIVSSIHPQEPQVRLAGVRYHTLPEDQERIAPQRALFEIQQMLPEDTIYTVDSGEHFLFATHYLRTIVPDGYLVMTGLGSMGQSIGAAIGAQLARPDRVVAAICGDGCFAMNAFEVATATQENIPIVVFVMNDERLGMVELGHSTVYGRAPTYSTKPMNVVKLSQALGAQSFAVHRPADLLGVDLLAMRSKGPIVVDVHIDPSIILPKKDRISGFSSHKQKRRILN